MYMSTSGVQGGVKNLTHISISTSLSLYIYIGHECIVCIDHKHKMYIYRAQNKSISMSTSTSTCRYIYVCTHTHKRRKSWYMRLAGSWQQRHASLHSHAPLCTSSVTLTPRSRRPSSNKRAGSSKIGGLVRLLAASPPQPPSGSQIGGLFRRGGPSGAMYRSRGPPPASSSPLGAYSSPAAHRITPHNLTRPLDLPLSTHILVEQPLPRYTQRLHWVSGHHMTREQHASLSPAQQF